jgi:SAM-dependent methyltransferase
VCERHWFRLGSVVLSLCAAVIGSVICVSAQPTQQPSPAGTPPALAPAPGSSTPGSQPAAAPREGGAGAIVVPVVLPPPGTPAESLPGPDASAASPPRPGGPPPGGPGGPAAGGPGGPPPGGPGGPAAGGPGGPPPDQPTPRGPVYNGGTIDWRVPVHSSMSLIHVGSNDSFAITGEGREAATLLLNAIEERDRDRDKAVADARQSSAIYTKIIPRENYGGEYSALQWFDDYIAAEPDQREKFLEDPQVRFFFMKFSANNFSLLREFLLRKYRIRDIGDEETKNGQDRKIWIEDTMLFENPRRETWEKTSRFLKLIKIHKGEKIADLGSGPGYYTFRFAKEVGPDGAIYAIDMDAPHLKWVEEAKPFLGFTNVYTVQNDGDTLGLSDTNGKLDMVFLCSLYHNIYGMMTPPQRDSLVKSIRDGLKDGGLVYLADNGVVPEGTLPYHGPYVAKQLIIGQMMNYGFRLLHDHQPIAQRYLLVFQKKPDKKPPRASRAKHNNRHGHANQLRHRAA